MEASPNLSLPVSIRPIPSNIRRYRLPTLRAVDYVALQPHLEWQVAPINVEKPQMFLFSKVALQAMLTSIWIKVLLGATFLRVKERLQRGRQMAADRFQRSKLLEIWEQAIINNSLRPWKILNRTRCLSPIIKQLNMAQISRLIWLLILLIHRCRRDLSKLIFRYYSLVSSRPLLSFNNS